jgi:hypothetical protein
MADTKKLLSATEAGVLVLAVCSTSRQRHILPPLIEDFNETHVISLIGMSGALAMYFSVKMKAIAKTALTVNNIQTFGGSCPLADTTQR